jgi:hypothetical protein
MAHTNEGRLSYLLGMSWIKMCEDTVHVQGGIREEGSGYDINSDRAVRTGH